MLKISTALRIYAIAVASMAVLLIINGFMVGHGWARSALGGEAALFSLLAIWLELLARRWDRPQ